MAKSGIISHLQNVSSKNVADKLKGMFDKFSKSNTFGRGLTMKKQTIGSAPRTRPGRKSTPRTGKR